MSALPLLEPTIRPQPRPAPRPRVLPRRRKTARPVVRPRSMPRSQVKALEKVTERALIFCGIAIAAFMVSSLIGHVMVEKSRRDGLAALSRLRDAKKAEGVLQEEVYALASDGTIRAWATEHGFRAPEDEIKSNPEKTLVATR